MSSSSIAWVSEEITAGRTAARRSSCDAGDRSAGVHGRDCSRSSVRPERVRSRARCSSSRSSPRPRGTLSVCPGSGRCRRISPESSRRSNPTHRRRRSRRVDLEVRPDRRADVDVRDLGEAVTAISPEAAERRSSSRCACSYRRRRALALRVFGAYAGGGSLEVYAVVGLGMVHADSVASRRWVFNGALRVERVYDGDDGVYREREGRGAPVDRGRPAD